MQAFDF
jgi:hypothetical protein